MRSVAQQMNLTGTVRNLSDGSVEIQCSCSKDELGLFIERIERLNDFIKVDELEVSEIPEQEFEDFVIVR